MFDPTLETLPTERLRDLQQDCRTHAYEHGVDLPSADAWRWPG